MMSGRGLAVLLRVGHKSTNDLSACGSRAGRRVSSGGREMVAPSSDCSIRIEGEEDEPRDMTTVVFEDDILAQAFGT